ncbi:hypothetical protein roselon_01519 [Roseibacterium elongatum DSM 19469]|uniref:DUF6473 domain-containing protein n=2 Tax=Roseicyclus elongatus TaxID=159346 RepID=W8S187_9RHOB|nr:hypothetical protein roselon_01519 [Roseibacterium elongatum DSM 19469]
MPLDYQPVAYPGSVLRFRGPASDLTRPFVLCLGATETFGRFVHDPYPAQLMRRLEAPVVNMGVMGAGLDVILGDRAIRAGMHKARAIVLQITGAQNMSNRFYTVHPRRNDRFLKASTMLQTVYPEVDFTEFHFTGHLLTHLRACSRDRFAILQHELRTAWRARMLRFLASAPAPVHLLWLSRRPPEEVTPGGRVAAGEPMFITAPLLEEVAAQAASLTVAVSSRAKRTHALRGMFYGPGEEAAARALPGPEAHRCAAEGLAALMQPCQASG